MEERLEVEEEGGVVWMLDELVVGREVVLLCEEDEDEREEEVDVEVGRLEVSLFVVDRDVNVSVED